MDIESVEKLAEMLNKSTLTELTVSSGDSSIKIRKPVGLGQDFESEHDDNDDYIAEEENSEPQPPSLVEVRSQMVGIFHLADGISVGSIVEEKKSLGTVESMKLMNEVTCPESGVIEELFVEEGSPVEFEQVLMTIRRPV